MSLSANTSCLEKLVPIFTSHMLGNTCHSSTYFLLLPFIQCLMLLGKTKTCTPSCKCNGVFFSIMCTWKQGCHVWQFQLWHYTNSYSGFHCPTFFGMIGWQSCNVPVGSKQLVFNTDMMYAIPCSPKFKGSYDDLSF